MAACCAPAAEVPATTAAMQTTTPRVRVETSLAMYLMTNRLSAMSSAGALPFVRLVVPATIVAGEVDHARATEILHRLRALEIDGAPDHTGEAHALFGDDAKLVALIVGERRVLEQACRSIQDRAEWSADLSLHRERRLADPGEPARTCEVLLRGAQRSGLLHLALGDLDPRAQVLRRARLGDVVVGARIEHRLEAARIVVGRDDENEGRPSRLVGADAAAQLQPVEPRRLEIEDDERRGIRLVRVERLPPVVEGGGFMAELLEHGVQQRAHACVGGGKDDSHEALRDAGCVG